jgi:uncharacterized protein YggE
MMKEPTMVSRAVLMVALVVVALATTSAAGAAPSAAPSAQALQDTGVSVVGEGRVVASPDIAHVVFGVEQLDPSLSQALSNASSAMNRVIDRLVHLGVSRDEIKTINFSVSPVYDNRGENQTLRGYRVSNSVSATIRDLNQLGSIIDEVVAVGANRVEGVAFETSRLSELKDQARAEAMANARAKAEQLARLAGANLGQVVRIEESDASGSQPARAVAQVAAAAPTPIEPGQLEIRTTVRVVWYIG